MMCIFWISLILKDDISSFTLIFLSCLPCPQGFQPRLTVVESFSV